MVNIELMIGQYQKGINYYRERLLDLENQIEFMKETIVEFDLAIEMLKSKQEESATRLG